MTHLRIELNTITENVTSNVIHKLYETAKAIIDAEEANDVQESLVSLKGNLLVPISYRAEVTWLLTKFPDLYITSADYAIPFEDPNMLSYLLSLGIGSNGMITESLAAAATVVANSGNSTVTKFNELKYFTGITGSNGGLNSRLIGVIKFKGWSALQEIDISNFTSIGHNSGYAYEDTFTECSSLKTVKASNKLTNIGYAAFKLCTNLENITGLSGVINVYDYAFYNCKLTNDSFLNTQIKLVDVTNNGCQFYGCRSLTSIALDPTTSIPNYCFRDCSSLTTITGTNNIETVKASAFYANTALSSIDLSSCTSVGESAFYNCSSLTSLDLSSCTTIGKSAFQGCTSLASIDLSNVTSIGNNAFNGCTGLASITDLSNCTTLGRGTFGECSNLDITNWDLSNVTKIGTTCFWGCSKLKGTLNLSGVTTFDGVILQLFSGCSGLLKIVIGHLPLALGSNRAGSNRSPFYNCTSLKVVDINQLDGLFFSNNPIFKNTPAFEALIIRNTSLIPAITYDDYTSQALWSTFAESSTPKIYVDDNLYSTYINHADWSDLASHIEPLSNYVES